MFVTMPNFVPIGQTVFEIYPFFDFLDSGRTPSWICFTRLDHTQRVFGGLCHCIKFSWNRCSSVDNMQVLIFRALGLNFQFTPQKGVFGDLTPKVGSSMNAIPLPWCGLCASRIIKQKCMLGNQTGDVSSVRPDHPRCRSATCICVCGHTHD